MMKKLVVNGNFNTLGPTLSSQRYYVMQASMRDSADRAHICREDLAIWPNVLNIGIYKESFAFIFWFRVRDL